MISIKKPRSLKEKSFKLKKEGLKIGLVPTMGFLHQGHTSLIRFSKKQCDITIVTIFVNPLQFGQNEDFSKYPRDMDRDKKILQDMGVDILFAPQSSDMYAEDHGTYVEVESLSDVMCGRSRPGHFRGVCTVVLKLFNIAIPDAAYFGKKDYQQFIILKKMVKDLDLQIRMIGCPTVREKDGLALSSRNKYLNGSERDSAKSIYRSLLDSEKTLREGESDLEGLSKKTVKTLLGDENIKKVDYYDFRDPNDLSEIRELGDRNEVLIAAAVWVGSTRLIDNIVVKL